MTALVTKILKRCALSSVENENLLTLAVFAWREDNIGITWSVRLDALPDRVDVSGGVERDDGDGVHEVFVRSESAITATEAADAIGRIAAVRPVGNDSHV